MVVIGLCVLGLLLSAVIAIDSIGTQKKVRSSCFAALNVAIMLGCAWKMTDVARTVADQKSSLRENARTQTVVDRGLARLAQATGADGSGASSEIVLSVLGRVSASRLKELAAQDSDDSLRRVDRQKVLSRLNDIYAGQAVDMPRDDQGDTALPSLQWINQTLAENGFRWRVRKIANGRAETYDVDAAPAPDGPAVPVG